MSNSNSPDFYTIAQKGIQYVFYAIFFLTPLILFPKTFELFEFNKLWTIYGLSLVILFLWVSKMVMSKRFYIKRTPFDIPIALFLLSQIISTFFSMEPHTSFWGYYARFNGGLLSLITYIVLYYAFVSNMVGDTTSSDETPDSKHSSTYKILLASVLSGVVVALWGIPSHFGYDLTCLVFRGSLDTSCWTDAFQPTVRMFSTLGQPNWLAAFMAVLIPIAVTLGLTSGNRKFKSVRLDIFFFASAAIFYICVLWSGSQSGLLGLAAGFLLFLGIVGASSLKTMSLKDKTFKSLGILIVVFAVTTFFIGVRTSSLSALNFKGLVAQFSKQSAPVAKSAPIETPVPAGELGGSDSGKIRSIVWQGAIEIFKKHPIIGTGVETFAYAYYEVKPVEHNLLSEWDFLYNKAHNEYLNYLATTGMLGLGTYLFIIVWVIRYTIKSLQKMAKKNGELDDKFPFLMVTALLAAYISILVSNFFGFSVVVINLFFFLIPGFILNVEGKKLKEFSWGSRKKAPEGGFQMNPVHTLIIVPFGVVCLIAELFLLNMWLADQSYSSGYNLNRAQQYVMANEYLENAVKLNPWEDLYKDELATNVATIAILLNQQNDKKQAVITANRAKVLSDEIIKRHPNNIVFIKSRTQVAYLLSQIDKKYFKDAILAINRGQELAPTDAKIAYNAGLLYGQEGDTTNAVKMLRLAIKLKPNYRDPHYALGVFLTQQAKDEPDPIKKAQLNAEAKTVLEYSLKNIAPDDPKIKELLESIEQ